MRPLRLELRGFTSFRNPVTVDFTGKHLFAITGPTGAGKSSLLDAMTWALYGQAPRVGRETSQLVNPDTGSMAVKLDFRVLGQDYRVSRHAPATLGARLERLREDGVWESLEDRARAVTSAVTGIIGLDYATFIKTVLLPQGAFGAFLQGDPRERRNILTNLLGLERHEEAGRRARVRASNAQSAAGALREQLSVFGAPSEDEICNIERDHANAKLHVADLNRRSPGIERMRDAATATIDATRTTEHARDALTEAIAERDASRDLIARVLTERDDAADAHARREADLAAVGYDDEEHRNLLRDVATLQQREVIARDLSTAEERLDAAQSERAETDTRLQEAQAHLDDARVAAVERERHAAHAAEGLADAIARAIGSEHLVEAMARQHAETISTLSETLHTCEGTERRLRDLRDRRHEQSAVTVSAARSADEAERDLRAARRLLDATAPVFGAALSEHKMRSNAVEHERRRDMAVALRRTLTLADPCPVCGETVAHAPAETDAAESATSLAMSERALVEATTMLDLTRAEQARAQVAVGSAEGRDESERATATRAADALRAIDAAIRNAGAESRTLDADIARVTEQVGDGRRHIEQQMQARDAAMRSLNTLRELRAAAAAAAGLTEQPQPGEPGDPARIADDLTNAISRHRAERTAATAATNAVTALSSRVDAAAMTINHVGARCDDLAATVADLQRRLHDAPAPSVGATVLRARLRAAEDSAGAHRAAAEMFARAREHLAATEASVRAAEEALDRTDTTAARREQESAAHAAELEAAVAAFAHTWRDAAFVGEPASAVALTAVDAHRALLRTAEQSRDEVAGILTGARDRAKTAKRMAGEATQHESEASVATDLAHELRRDRFIAHVQHEAMRRLAAAASAHLGRMSHNRYELTATTDAFSVRDHHHASEIRPVHTLSGGETFLASLALSLALSERLPALAGRGGAMALDALFLDEGFGTLDQESLDIAIGALEALAGEHRMIGVISHVAEVAERLPDRIEVLPAPPGGSSVLRVPAVLRAQ